MRKSDIPRLEKILKENFIENMEGPGFAYIGMLTFRKQPHPKIYHEVVLTSYSGGDYPVFALFLITSPGQPLEGEDKRIGTKYHFPFFRVGIDTLLNETKMGRKYRQKRKPNYTYKDPRPYLSWLIDDVRPVWEDWFSQASTPEAVLRWLIEGTGKNPDATISGLGSYARTMKAARFLAYLGRHEEALTLATKTIDYWKMKPRKLEELLLQELKSGKREINPADWGVVLDTP